MKDIAAPERSVPGNRGVAHLYYGLWLFSFMLLGLACTVASFDYLIYSRWDGLGPMQRIAVLGLLGAALFFVILSSGMKLRMKDRLPGISEYLNSTAAGTAFLNACTEVATFLNGRVTNITRHEIFEPSFALNHTAAWLAGRNKGRISFGDVFLVCTPVLLYLIFAPLQLYIPSGWVDAGIYTGLFLDLPGQMERFGGNYFSVRWSWTVLGYAVYSIFSAALAPLFLMGLINFFAALLSYILLARHYSRAAGLTGALLLVCTPQMTAASSFGYVDGIVIVYMLAAMVFLDTALSHESKRWPYILSGAFFCSAAIAHPYAAIILIVAALSILSLHARLTVADTIRVATLTGAGFILAFFIYSILSISFGGRAFFLLDILATAAYSLAGLGRYYRHPLHEWIPEALRLLVPFFLMLTGLMLVYIRKQRSGPLFSFWFLLTGSAGFMVIYDLVFRGSTLQHPFYASLVLPACALLGGALAGELFRKLNEKQLCFTLAALSAALLFPPLISLPLIYFFPPPSLLQTACMAVLLFVSCSVILTLLIRSAPAWATATGVLMMAGTISLINTVNPDTRTSLKASDKVDNHAVYETANQFFHYVERNTGGNQPLLIWFNREKFELNDSYYDEDSLVRPLKFGPTVHPLNIYDTLAAIYLWDRSLLSANFPELDQAKLDLFIKETKETTVFLMGQEERQTKHAIQTLQRLGYSVTEHDDTTLGEHPVHIRVSLLKVRCGDSPFQYPAVIPPASCR